MTKSYAKRQGRALALAYGPFVPGSVARAIRAEHQKLGLLTCWRCIRSYEARDPQSEPRERWHFCSEECFLLSRPKKPRRRVIGMALDADTFTLDLRGCRECSK